MSSQRAVDTCSDVWHVAEERYCPRSERFPQSRWFLEWSMTACLRANFSSATTDVSLSTCLHVVPTSTARKGVLQSHWCGCARAELIAQPLGKTCLGPVPYSGWRTAMFKNTFPRLCFFYVPTRDFVCGGWCICVCVWKASRSACWYACLRVRLGAYVCTCSWTIEKCKNQLFSARRFHFPCNSCPASYFRFLLLETRVKVWLTHGKYFVFVN